MCKAFSNFCNFTNSIRILIKNQALLKRYFYFFFLICLSIQSYGQIDKEFWFVAPECSSNHGDRPIYMRISTMEDPASINLRMPANLSFSPINQIIPPNTTFSINLTAWIDSIENKPADKSINRGLYLTSDNLVTAYYEIANGSNPAIFPLKGKNGLGVDFYIVSQNNYANQTNDGSEAFDIIATEDSTWVTIMPAIDIVGHQANKPVLVFLNKGQTYSARTLNTAATVSLAGSHVTSNKPIAITISDDSIITGGWDIIGDQIVPVNLLGKDYIVIKGYADNNPPSNNDERVYVLATEDGTDIRLDGSATPYTTLSKGQLLSYGIENTAPTVVLKASNPVYVYHLSGNPGEAGASLIPHDSCTGSRQIGFNRTSSSFFAMLILTRNGNQDSFYLNGNRTIITASDFSVVPGTSNTWVYARMSMSTGQVPVGNNLLLNTKGKFHLGIINNVSASSEYGYYSDFSSLYLGANRNICPGDSVKLDAGPYMDSYEWYKLTGGTFTLIDSTRFLTIHDSGFYAAVANGNFCMLQDTIHIGFYANATVDLGPNDTICEGTVMVLNPGIFLNYFWQNGGNGPVFNATTEGDYWVRVTNNNGCIASDTVFIKVDSIPRPTGPITGTTTVCQGQTGLTYMVSPYTYADTYSWSLPPGYSGSSATNSITLSFTTSALSDTIRVIAANYCGSGVSLKLGITVNPLPGEGKPVTGPSTVCQGQENVSYSMPAVQNATSYIWMLPPGATIISGAGTNTILVNYSYSAISGNIIANGHNDCGDGSTFSFPVTVNLFPHPAGVITGPLTVCQGQSGVIFTTPLIPGSDSYVWTLPPGALITSGTGTNNITVIFSVAATSGNISVSGRSLFCGDGQSSSFSLTVNPLPSPAGIISGNNPVCQAEVNAIYTVPPINAATSYSWSLPPGAMITGGNGTNSIMVSFSTSAVSGNITVLGHNALCGDGPDSFIAVTVNPLPLAAGNITGPSPVCQSSSGITYHVTPIPFAMNYTWIFTGTGATITNAGNDISIQFSPVATSGILTVRGENGCGNGPVSGNFNLTVDPIPITSLGICNTLTTHDAKPFKLTGGHPLGGTYSGTGVSGTTFTPTSVPVLIDTAWVSYSYTNVYGCLNVSRQMITLLNSPSFSCGGMLTDIRDNQTYSTIKIGNQCWMAANLNYGVFLASAQYPGENCVPEKYCFNDNPTNCSIRGGLYSWDEMMQYDRIPSIQGLCPPSWHIPTSAEWNTLFSQFINNGFAGSPLKATGYSGFNALLNGERIQNKGWYMDNFSTFLWSCTSAGNLKAWAYGMNIYNPSVSSYPSTIINAFSVRCLKD